MSEPSLPREFIDNMRPLLQGELDAFLDSYRQPALRGIRFRDARRPLPADSLQGDIGYAKNACYLSADSTAGAIPLHEAGAYYLQEPSAMAAAAALNPQDGDRVLDLCAAPGGKSTQLAMSASLALLVANEPILSRAQVLSANIERMGIGNAVVTCAYPDALAARWHCFFDKILVDAPCSGEGMFRRHPETRAEWNPDSPSRCAERQAAILDSAASMLRPGGRLAYSTCTFNSLENEGSIRHFIERHPDFHLAAFALPGLPAAPQGMLHLWPHQIRGEGHFVALLEKDADAHGVPADVSVLPSPDHSALQAFASFAQETACAVRPNAVFAGHLIHAPAVLPPLDRIRTLRIGLQLGEVRGKVFVPDHALALGAGIERQHPLSDAQARAYIHGDALPCADSLRGYYAVTVDGYTLGFAKASDGLLKNHYPKGLRK